MGVYRHVFGLCLHRLGDKHCFALYAKVDLLSKLDYHRIKYNAIRFHNPFVPRIISSGKCVHVITYPHAVCTTCIHICMYVYIHAYTHACMQYLLDLCIFYAIVMHHTHPISIIYFTFYVISCW